MGNLFRGNYAMETSRVKLRTRNASDCRRGGGRRRGRAGGYGAFRKEIAQAQVMGFGVPGKADDRAIAAGRGCGKADR